LLNVPLLLLNVPVFVKVPPLGIMNVPKLLLILPVIVALFTVTLPPAKFDCKALTPAPAVMAAPPLKVAVAVPTVRPAPPALLLTTLPPVMLKKEPLVERLNMNCPDQLPVILAS
jgi:hypothetical protein